MNEDLNYEELSERVGSDIYMTTSRNGKEIRKAYETVAWKSEKEINSFPTYSELKVIGEGIQDGVEEANQTLNLAPGQSISFTTNPNYINLGFYSSDISVAHVSVYKNDTEKRIEATNPGNATITLYDVNKPEITVSIDVTVSGGEESGDNGEQEPTT